MIKNMSLIIALALLLSAPVFANENGHPMKDKAHWGEKRMERLTEKLSLSDEQAAQIKAIFEASKEKMMALQKETHEQVAAVLTPEQNETYAAMKKEHQEKRKEHKGNLKEHKGTEEEQS